MRIIENNDYIVKSYCSYCPYARELISLGLIKGSKLSVIKCQKTSNIVQISYNSNTLCVHKKCLEKLELTPCKLP